MTFEDAGKILDSELKKFVEFVEQKVRPATQREMADILRKASEHLAKMAEHMDKP